MFFVAGWAGYHIDGSAIKPAKDVNPIISNKYVPFSYLTDNYLAYSVPFDKKISVSYPTNKMILLPDESRFPLYSFNYVTSSQLHRPVSYATKFFQIYNPTAVENKIPIDLSNPFLTQHLSSVPYSLKQNLFRPEVFFHAADVNKNLPGAIISKNENAPEFRIRLVPIPVENSISQNYPSRQANEENDLDEQFRSGTHFSFKKKNFFFDC